MLASVAGAAGALASSYFGLALSRALVGFGTAAVVPVANSILGQIFEGPKKASRMAIFNLGLFLGGVVGFAVGQRARLSARRRRARGAGRSCSRCVITALAGAAPLAAASTVPWLAVPRRGSRGCS